MHANQLLLTRAGLRRSPQPDREQTAAILRVIQEVSAVSVCNRGVGSVAALSSPHLLLSTALVSNENLPGYALLSELDAQLASPCHKARDQAACCSNSRGQCCTDAACAGRAWASPRWLQGPSVVVMPRAVPRRSAAAYEVQLAQVRGNPVDNTALLSAWGMFVAVREADSERLLAPSAPGEARGG